MNTIQQPRVEDFIDLAWQIYADDPRWIPPMRDRLQQELTGADAFGRYGRLQLFGCESGGKLAGRIAAIVNSRLSDSDGRPVGQVGYFEAVDDDQVASRLFAAAFDWLRTAGARLVLGPMNGGPHRTHRLMTDGFDRDPFLFEPRNPAYYPRLFEAGGFRPASTWYSIDVSRDRLQVALDSLAMLQVRPENVSRYQVVAADLSDPAAVLQQLHALLDDMWTGHVGYTSLELDEFVELFGPALSLMTPGDVHLAVERASSRHVGCAFTFPDYAADVRALDGDSNGWGSWRRGGTHPRRLVLHTMGASPRARRSGLASWLLRKAIEHCVGGYEEGVLALVVQELGSLRRIAPPTRHYALYARPLE